MIHTSELILNFLFSACWQIPILAAIAFGLSKSLGRKSPRAEHTIWVATLLFALFLPTTTCLLIEGYRSKSPAVPADNAADMDRGDLNGEPSIGLDRPSFPFSGTTVEKRVLPLSRDIALAIVGFYLLFFAFRGTQLFRAWQYVKAIRRSEPEVVLPKAVDAAAQKCCRQMNIENVSIRFSAVVSAPVTVGVFKPLIVLPQLLLAETEEKTLLAAIGHELAHIKRRDFAFNLLYWCVYLLLSFHPAIAFVKRRIDQTRELCCDEAVVGRLLLAEDYARSLVKLADWAINSRTPSAVTIGMGDAENLEERIMSLLNISKMNLSRKRMLLLITGLSIVIAPCIAVGFIIFRVGVTDVAAQQITKPESKDVKDMSAKEIQEMNERREHIRQENLEQARFAKEAKITLDQAIQTALGQQPGIIMETKLGRESSGVVFKIFILDKDSDDHYNLVVISGTDGHVIRAEKEKF